MLTEEQGHTFVNSLFHVYDMVLITHLVEKSLRAGIISGKELKYVNSLREKAIAGAQIAAGVDIDSVGSKNDKKTQGEV